jgi:hypothetical protein
VLNSSVLFKENQIAELMKNSGDSSQQLSLMNEQLRERDRLVAFLWRFPLGGGGVVGG